MHKVVYITDPEGNLGYFEQCLSRSKGAYLEDGEIVLHKDWILVVRARRLRLKGSVWNNAGLLCCLLCLCAAPSFGGAVTSPAGSKRSTAWRLSCTRINNPRSRNASPRRDPVHSAA